MSSMNYIYYVKLTPKEGDAITESFERQDVAQFYIKSLLKTHFSKMKIVRANKYLWYARGDDEYWKIELLIRPMATSDDSMDVYKQPYAMVVTRKGILKPTEVIPFPAEGVARDYVLHKFKTDIAKNKMVEVRDNQWSLFQSVPLDAERATLDGEWHTKVEVVRPDRWYSNFEYCVDILSLSGGEAEHHSFDTKEDADNFFLMYMNKEGVEALRIGRDLEFIKNKNTGNAEDVGDSSLEQSGSFDDGHMEKDGEDSGVNLESDEIKSIDSYEYQVFSYVKAKNIRSSNEPYQRDKYFTRVLIKNTEGEIIIDVLLPRINYLESYIKYLFRSEFFSVKIVRTSENTLVVGEDVGVPDDEDYILGQYARYFVETSSQGLFQTMKSQ